MSDYEKIITASMYMEAKADYWYLDYVEGRENMSWNRFVDVVTDRFSMVGEENIIGEFNKLKQDGTVEEYQERFEELKSFMLNMNRSLTEDYFVKSFLSGLKEEIRHMVYMLRPVNLTQAIQSARMQEQLIDATIKLQKVQIKQTHTIVVSSKQQSNNYSTSENKLLQQHWKSIL